MKFRRTLFFLAVIAIAFASAQHFLSGSNAQGGPPGPPPPVFYDMDVVAVAGQNSVTSLFAAPSINDKGVVAMSGRVSGGGAVFISDAVGSNHNIIPTFSNPTRFFGGTVQINNNNQVVSQEFVSGTSPAINFLRVSDGNGINLSTVIYGANGTGGFNNFDAIYPNPAINDSNQVSFSAIIGTNTTNLITGVVKPAFNQAQYANTGGSLRPMIANDGRVAVQAGGASTSPILLYQNDLASSTAIASSTNGFSALGQSPGVSDDGKIVVFYGNLTTGPVTGPGIFASIENGASPRELVRLTGRPGELGTDAAGNPLLFSSVGYVPTARVSVIHQELGPAGLNGDSLVVSFMGTPTAISPDGLFNANLGLWTIRADIKLQNGVLDYRPEGAMPVVQLFDTISGFQIMTISVYDAIAKAGTETINGAARTEHRGENRVCFFATTNSANIVVRATYLDSDEDSLSDRWETSGVTIGGQFFDLPGMGASPNHKDLFVHADWMQPGGGVVSQPKPAALSRAIGMFRNAPVSNPDGSDGINIHIDAGPDSIMNPVTNRRWKSFSRAGSVPYQHSIVNGGSWAGIDTIKNQHFTNNRRGPIFHYCLFADALDNGTNSGESRDMPATDFVVTLGTAQVHGGTVQEQAGTFVHELGHNLGLRHGGNEDTPEYKPNYLSLMNYRFQFHGLIKADGKREMNYSTSTLSPLNENGLVESVGISDPDNHRTIWGSISFPCGTNLPLPAVDWNCDGSLTAGSVIADINGDFPALATLFGFNDWPAIVFDGGGRIGSGASRGAPIGGPGSPAEAPIADLSAAPPDILQQELCEIEENVVVTPEDGGAAPLAVTVDASSSVAPCGKIVSYVWDFGDGTTSEDPRIGEEVGMGFEENGQSIISHTYTAPGTYVATVNITDSEGYTNLVPIEYVVPVSDGAGPQADLAITMTALPSPATTNSTLTYTLSVTNNGAATAIGTVVSDTLPGNLTFVSATTTQGSCDGTSTINCSLGSLANAATATVTIVVTPTAAGTLVNTASVESNVGDPNLANNSATTNTLVTNAGANSPILFTSERDGNSEIYKMQSDGSGQTRLTNNAAADSEPVWSPDRSQIAFVSNRTGFGEIFLMNPDGSGQTQLSNLGGFITDITWSPDGNYFAFAMDRDIYVMNSDAGELFNVTHNHEQGSYYGAWASYAIDSSPSFSPDSGSITFAGNVEDSRYIFVMDIYEQIRHLIKSGDGISSPAWSVSNKIAYVDYGTIKVMNPDGSSSTSLTTGIAPAWSADGVKLVFATNRDGNYEIYKMDANGSNQTRLTNNSAIDSQPGW